MKLTRCPMCNSRALGRVGLLQFYCGDCCVEFAVGKQGVVVYEILDDGSVVSISDSAVDASLT
ncbi:MAG: hypothetical protein DDT20_00227 [Firmicutes bacterium]|nr:hypothetical protein [Bacillota bacterium]